LGVAEIPLSGLVDRRPQRMWLRVSDSRGARAAAARALAASVGGEEEVATGSSSFSDSPDLGRVEVWLRYAYNPALDPAAAPPPPKVDARTCTSTDLPSSSLVAAEPMMPADALPASSGAGRGRGSAATLALAKTARQESGTGAGADAAAGPDTAVVSANGLESPRWFYLDSPREDEEDDDLGALKPRGPFNVAGLRDLFAAHTIDNGTRVWREGMNAWAACGAIPDLKRRLWAYPDPPRREEALSAEDKAAALGAAADRRWFFVDEAPDGRKKVRH